MSPQLRVTREVSRSPIVISRNVELSDELPIYCDAWHGYHMVWNTLMWMCKKKTCTLPLVASFPGSSPAFCRILYATKAGEEPGNEATLGKAVVHVQWGFSLRWFLWLRTEVAAAAAAEFRSTVMIALSYSGGYYDTHWVS